MNVLRKECVLKRGAARENLAQLVRKARERTSLSRKKFEKRAHLRRGVLARIEHKVENFHRGEIEEVIKFLNLSLEEEGRIYKLLQEIFPQRRRVKFHLHISILSRRSGRGNYGRR